MDRVLSYTVLGEELITKAVARRQDGDALDLHLWRSGVVPLHTISNWDMENGLMDDMLN